MGDILKEAIADAKAVRETALQNAKMALEEAFTPQLKSMLSAKLKEDEFEDEEPFVAPEEEPEVPAEEGYYEDEEFGEEEPVPGEEIPLAAQDEIPGEVPGEVPGEEIPLAAQDEIPGEVPGEEEDELDLEAIIRELEMEIGESVEEKDNAYNDNVEGDEQPEHGIQTPMGEQANDNGNGDDDDDEIEVDESLFKEEDLGNGNPDEKDNAYSDDGDYDIKEQSDSSEIGAGDNKVDVADASDEEDPEKGPGVEQAPMGESRLRAELAEYKQAVSFLKDKLHEVNILNAKLLFTNKLFKSFSLDNNQKLNVVETFDRAQTTREIKLVYSTLFEQFGSNNSITRKKSINESASSAIGSTKPSPGSRKVISEEAQVANRFKKLAGLIK